MSGISFKSYRQQGCYDEAFAVKLSSFCTLSSCKGLLLACLLVCWRPWAPRLEMLGCQWDQSRAGGGGGWWPERRQSRAAERSCSLFRAPSLTPSSPSSSASSCLVHIPAGGRAPLACPALCLGSTLNGEQEAPTPAIPYRGTKDRVRLEAVDTQPPAHELACHHQEGVVTPDI